MPPKKRRHTRTVVATPEQAPPAPRKSSRAPIGYHVENGRYVPNGPAEVPEMETPSPIIPVVVARKQPKTGWHIVRVSVERFRPDRSTIRIVSDEKLSGAASAPKAILSATKAGQDVGSMFVIPDESQRFEVHCPEHGLVRRNTTEEYALDGAFHHQTTEHVA